MFSMCEKVSGAIIGKPEDMHPPRVAQPRSEEAAKTGPATAHRALAEGHAGAAQFFSLKTMSIASAAAMSSALAAPDSFTSIT